MHPHPRIRKTIKWGGAVLTALLVAVWIGSGWCRLAYLSGSGTGILMYAGRLAFAIGIYSDQPEAHGMSMGEPTSFWMNLWFECDKHYAGWIIGVPLWFPMMFALSATIAAWRLDTLARHRACHNLCPTCRYDRTGLASPSVPCPECGSPPPSPRSAA